MRMLKSRTGKFKFDVKNAGVMVQAVILLVIGLRVFAVGLPEIAEAGNEVYEAGGNATVPRAYALTSLFASDSVLLLAIVGGFLVAVVFAVMSSNRR